MYELNDFNSIQISVASPEKIREWSLFCNQLDEVVPLSMLTHINSTLYNGITRRFVINEEEYKEDSHLIDRYLMKEKDQYEKIITLYCDGCGCRFQYVYVRIRFGGGFTDVQHSSCDKRTQS